MSKTARQATADQAARIKTLLPLEDFLRSEKGLVLNPEGSGFKALCPFHDDKRPSLWIDAKPRTRYTCFGCGKSGDVVSWVMEESGRTFTEAVDELSIKLGLPPIEMGPAERSAYDAKVKHHAVMHKVNDAFITFAMAEAGKHLPAFRGYLVDQRGISLETAKRYRIGYLESTQYQVRKALLDAGCTIADIDESMILVDERMFDRRVIVGVQNHKQVRMVYGRTIDPKVEPKHLYQKGVDKALFNLDRIDASPRLILVESIFDALSLIELGYEHEVVGAMGANLTDGQVRDLQRTKKKVWLLFDNDAAGAKASIETGLALVGNHAIAKLKGKIKDPNDFLTTGGTKTELDTLLEEAKGENAPKVMIRAMDATMPKHELPRAAMPVLEALARMEEFEAGSGKPILGNEFKAHFSLSVSDMVSYKAKLEKLHKKLLSEDISAREASRMESPDLPEEEVDVKELHNGVSYVGGKLWYQFLVPRVEKRIDPKTHTEKMVKLIDAWYVSSTRDFKNRAATKVNDEIVVDDMPIGIRPGRWSTAKNTPNSIYAWKDKNEKVSAKDTFDDIRKLLTTYLWFPDERYHDLLTAWVFMTYWTPIFDTVGYLFLHASPRSGKTTAMTVLAQIAYEAELMGDVSGSALFRKIEGSKGAMLLDEMEKLASDEFARSGDPINQVLLTGYKSTGATGRTNLDKVSETNTGSEMFSTFCAKIIANTQGIHVATIRDRSIELMLLRSDHKLPQFNERKHVKLGTFAKIRNAMYCLALKHVDEVQESYEDGLELAYGAELEKRGLFGRDYEVWAPLWATAMLLEDQGVPGLVSMFIDMAAEHRDVRDVTLAEDSIDTPILKALRRFVTEHAKTIAEVPYAKGPGGPGEWYGVETVLDYLKQYRRLDRTPQVKLIETMRRLRISPAGVFTTSYGGHSVRVMRITKTSVTEAIARYNVDDADLLMKDETLFDSASDEGLETLSDML